MGERVHEHVDLEVDSSQLTGNVDDMTEEEKLHVLLEAMAAEDTDIEIETTTEEIQ